MMLFLWSIILVYLCQLRGTQDSPQTAYRYRSRPERLSCVAVRTVCGRYPTGTT